MKKNTDSHLIWESYLTEASASDIKKKADIDNDGKVSEYEKKRADELMKNDDDSENDKHICATKVEHHKFGHGQCIFAEHADPNTDGYVSWYNVQFDHGAEVINTTDLTVHEESHHGKH